MDYNLNNLLKRPIWILGAAQNAHKVSTASVFVLLLSKCALFKSDLQNSASVQGLSERVHCQTSVQGITSAGLLLLYHHYESRDILWRLAKHSSVARLPLPSKFGIQNGIRNRARTGRPCLREPLFGVVLRETKRKTTISGQNKTSLFGSLKGRETKTYLGGPNPQQRRATQVPFTAY